MEEILSSIKRIIAEEGDTTPGRGRRAGRAAPPSPVADDPVDDRADTEVLELSDPMPHDRPVMQQRAIAPDRAPAPDRSPVQDRPAPRERPAAPAAEQPARVVDRSPEPPVASPRPIAAPAREAAANVRPSPASRPDESVRGLERAADAAPLVSSGTVEATRDALDQLSRLLVKPEPGADGTLEGMVREMLRPMLRDWLDASLPSLVEDMVAREIEKIICARR